MEGLEGQEEPSFLKKVDDAPEYISFTSEITLENKYESEKAMQLALLFIIFIAVILKPQASNLECANFERAKYCTFRELYEMLNKFKASGSPKYPHIWFVLIIPVLY